MWMAEATSRTVRLAAFRLIEAGLEVKPGIDSVFLPTLMSEILTIVCP